MAGSFPTGLLERIENEVAALGFECVEVTFAVESGRRILRVTLDSGVGIRLDECARVSRALAPLLDSWPGLPSGYYLEVSSPGINRPLTKPEHYRRFRGERAKIRLREELAGGSTVTGVIGELEDDVLLVETPHGTRRIPLGQIVRARLQRDLGQALKGRRDGAAR